MKKGFSLIELIISLAIISFLVLILSNLFSLNINILNKSYQEEKDYKQAYTAMAFIDNTLNMACKIEEANHENCNFEGYLMGSGTKLTRFYFYTKDGFLCIYRDDISKDSKGRENRISECGNLNLYYDKNKKIIKIRLTSKNGKHKFTSAIYVGNKLWKKLWKKPSLVFMFC